MVKKLLSKSYGFALDEQDEKEIEEIKRIEESEKIEKEKIKMLKDPKTKEALKRAALKAAIEVTKSGGSNEEIFRAA